MSTLYPTGYGKRLVSIDALFYEHHIAKMHPEFARRLRAWLIHMDGEVGIGGSWRDDGSQPDKPGFAPEGRSFHQYQRFASGLVKFAAVDLVRRDGPDPDDKHDGMPWHLAPVQGSPEAAKWGLHINVGVPGNGEAWHMQPIEIDGWASWMSAGCPDPVAGYPLPGDVPEEDDDMHYLDTPERTYDSRKSDGQLKAGEVRKVPVVYGHSAHVNITCVTTHGGGWVSVAGTPDAVGATSLLNFEARSGTQVRSGSAPLGLPDGHAYITTTVPCHVIVDVFAVGK